MGILSILGVVANMIPGISTIITSLTSSYFNSKVAITQAKIGGDVTVAQDLVRAAATSEVTSVQRLQVIGGSWVLSFLVVGFALPWIAYEWRCVVWDNVINNGATSTPAIGGQLADWAKTIIACLFGSGTVLTAGHMYFNRKDQ
jgi:hypothetical protein